MRIGSALCLVVLLPQAVAAATAVTVEDERVEGELIGLDSTPALTLRVEGQLRRMPCADLLELRLREGQPSPDPKAASLVLRDGRLLRGLLRGGSSRAVVVRSAVFGTLECPLGAMARIELPVPQPAQPLEAAEKVDRLLFRNGDLVEGTIRSFREDGVQFRSELLGDLSVGFDRLKAIAFAHEGGTAPAKPEGVVAIVQADDGTAIAGKIQSLNGGKLELKTVFGPTLSLDLRRLLRLEFRGGRLVYLSDLEPEAAKETPFFDLAWPHRRDRSVDGNPLRLGDRTYRKGLGVHSRCELTYALGGGYRRFLAAFGIDREVGEKGNVDVAVLVDGQVRFERKGVTGRDAPLPIALDVRGASRLTLVVDFGGEFDICDHADWADARLIR